MFFVLQTNGSGAQNYTISNKPQLTQQKHFYHTVIGQNAAGVYTLNYTNDYFAGGFSIERYDLELGFLDDKVINVPKRSYVLDFFLLDTQIAWVSVTRKRRENLRLSIQKLSETLDGEVTTSFIKHLPIKVWNPEDLKFSVSQRTKQWAVGLIYEGPSNSTIFSGEVFNASGELLQSYTDTLAEPLSNVALTEFKVSGGSEILAVLRVQRPRTLFSIQKDQQVLVFRCSPQTQELLEWQTTDPIQSMTSVYDRNQNQWIVGALVGQGVRELKGYSLLKFNLNQPGFQQVDQLFTDMQARILDGEIKSKKRKEPQNYVVRRLIPQYNGGVVLLLERYVELKQLETYYINGIPQTATKVLYNYNEIGALFVDSSGFCDTALRINKEQTASPSTAYLLGFGSFVCESGIHLVYNGDISKSNEVLEIVIRPDFEIETHTLINSENFYHVVVPFDGIESDYCTFTLPLLREKQWFWMQLGTRD